MGVADCKISQLRKEANSKQISYMTIDHASHAPSINYYIVAEKLHVVPVLQLQYCIGTIIL